MNRIFLILSLFLASSSLSQAQLSFIKTYGGPGSEGGTKFVQTRDGGYVFCGRTQSIGQGNGMPIW